MAENVPLSGSTSIASAQPSSMPKQRLSFASVAAMAPPSAQVEAGSTSPNKADKPIVTPASPFVPEHVGTIASGIDSEVLDDSLSRLEVKDCQIPVPDVPEHELRAPLQLRPQLDDEKTHLSFSSNKAPSLDGKSVASGTTFAMDEKESIRPDDSASVKAAEDDDSNSGPASGAPNSRVGSEAGERAFGNQFNEISQRIGPGMFRPMPQMGRAIPNVAEELRRAQLGSPHVVNPAAAGMPRTLPAMSDGASSSFSLPEQPDPKILEAMYSPKDRIFLLGLEQQVIAFIKDSNDPVLNLPPCNSFCRLLAHRLGDYYALGHVLDNSQSAVQLHRTPHCQLRPPLSTFETKSTPPNGVVASFPSMKIMRRAELAGEERPEGSGTNTTENSIGPSKAGSEADSDNQKGSGLVSPAESTSTKDKTATREEREAKYKEARDRIFADWKESEGVDTSQTEVTNDASRASSTNGKKKNKKKNNDDSFDSRSAYNIYFPSNQRQGPIFDSSGPMNFYYPYGQQNGQQMYPNGYQQPYPQQYQQMPQISQMSPMSPMPLMSQVPQVPQAQNYQMPVQPQNQLQATPGVYPSQGQQQYMQYGQQMTQNYYPQMQQPNQMMLPPQPSSMPSPASSNHSAQVSSRPQSQLSDQIWGQNAYQNPFQVFSPTQSQYAGQPQQAMPQSNSTNQQAIPYAFGQLPYQSSGQGSRPIHPIPGSYSRQNQYSNSPSRAPTDPNAFRSPSGGYHSSNMTTSYPPPQQPQFSPAQQFQPTFSSQHSSPRKPSAGAPRSQSPEHSTLAKWGTPSNLPPKPPPPAPTNPLVGGNAGGVPTFQNGMYSKPSIPSTDGNAAAEAVRSQ